MMLGRVLALAAAIVAVANTSAAQSKAPIGRFAADLRVASSGLPTEPGWTPTVPSGTIVPTRGLGLEAGAHVFVLRIKSVKFGVGASWLTARGSTSPPAPSGTTTAPPTIPDVTTRVTSFAPQVSMNFGHALGWSYVSAGIGRATATSEARLAGASPATSRRESDWTKTINFGGGARWYVNDHLGFGFDLRWHKISLVPASGTHPGAPRASLLVLGAGLVLK